MKKVKKPRFYEKGKWQYAYCSDSFTHEEGTEPASIYINCDAVNIKDAKKLSIWLNKAIKWLEAQK